MKTFTKLTNDTITENLFSNIDNQIVLEKLECTVLKNVAKQLLYQKTEQDKNLAAKKKEEEDLRGWSSVSSKSANQSFSKIFGTYYNTKQVNWSEIDNKSVTVYEPEDWNNKRAKDIKDILSSKRDAIIIIQNPTTNVYEWVVFNYENMIALEGPITSTNTHDFAGKKTGYSTPRGRWRDISLTEKVKFAENKRIYYIDLTGKTQEHNNLVQSREKAKEGMIYLDPYSLERMAKDNIDRYKKIVAQMKAKRENADDLLDKCQTIIQKVADLSIKIAKDPTTYADMIDPVNKLSAYIYDKVSYHPATRYQKQGWYSGVNGLLPTISSYISARNNASNGSYADMYRKDMENAKKTLEDSVKKIIALSQKYNIDLGVSE